MRRMIGLLKAADDLAERVIFDLLLTRWRWRTLAAAVVASACVILLRAPAPALERVEATAYVQTADPAEGGKLLFRRSWIDKKPKDYKSPFTMYGFSDEEIDSDTYFGFTVSGIPVKYQVELNGFRVKGDKLAFWFPADDSRVVSGFKVTKEKNGEFDLKLVIEKDPRHGGKSHTYYSRMDGKATVPGLALGADLEHKMGWIPR